MNKSPDAFRTISEVAEWLDVPKHVLRFWESKFAQVKPVKRAGGRRYYRPADMELLGGIKRLLHDDGLTIRGVQKLLREEGVRHVAGLSPATVDDVRAEQEGGPEVMPGPHTMPRAEPDSDRIDALLEEAAEDDGGVALPGPDTMPRAEPDPDRVDAVLEETERESSAADDGERDPAGGDEAQFELPIDLVTPAPPILADLLYLNADAFARAGVDPAPILDQAEALARSMDEHG